MMAPGHAGSLLPDDSEQDEDLKKKQEDKLNKRLEEESSAFFSSGRLWDDGVILPQDTRKVKMTSCCLSCYWASGNLRALTYLDLSEQT